jgi:hypothetical protein
MNWKINSFLPDVVQENFTVNNKKIKLNEKISFKTLP